MWRPLPRLLSAVVCTACLLGAVPARGADTRIATTPEALVASPVFFHGKQVVVRRSPAQQSDLWRLSDTAKPIFVIWRDRPTTAADVEIRGDFWDIGRLEHDDSRFSGVNFASLLDVAWHGQWPPRDQVFIITGATGVESPLPDEASIRAIALAPEHYADRQVKVVGRFRGANLYGDLPQPVSKSKWDFVIQSADAAVWVTGLRPKAKDLDLDIHARVDTGHWVQVTGTVRKDGPFTWIEGGAIAPATAPTETPIEVSVPAAPRQAPPTVVFTAPLAGEAGTDRSSPVRLQFSRDMDPRSFRDRVRVAYQGQAPPGAAAAPPAFTVRYLEGPRALEIKFSEPLDRFRAVKIDLLEGIVSAIDNEPLAPWSMTFTTGG